LLSQLVNSDILAVKKSAVLQHIERPVWENT